MRSRGACAVTKFVRQDALTSRYNIQVMSNSWLDELRPENCPPQIIRKDGLEIRSEVTAVRRRAMEHGPADYVTIWIKSSHGTHAAENTMSFEPKESYTRDQFEKSFVQSRAWFAELLAKDILGTSPPKPVYWSVAVWNPEDPSKRVNAIGTHDEAIPHTLVMKEMCDSLQLRDSEGGLKSAVVKVIARTFLIEVQPAVMSIPVVVGRDLLDKVRDGQTSTKPIEELFLSETTDAVIAQRKAKDKTILVIGSHSDEGIRRMRKIEGFLFEMGYEPVLIVDFGSSPEALETKFLSFAMLSKFVVYESSFSSGAIDEYKICKDNRIVTAVLHEEGRLATSMQDYAAEHSFIRDFPYELENIKAILRMATTWAEEFVNQRKLAYLQELDKNRYK
jgi:hypothetical protein